MRTRSRVRPSFGQIAVLLWGLCFLSAPTPGHASPSRSQILQRIRPEFLSMDPRGAGIFIRGRMGRVDLASPGPAAVRLLEELAPLFHDSGSERFRVVKVKHDELGLTHVRVQQFIEGLPVVGADAYVHIGRDGNVYAINGTIAKVEAVPRGVELSAVAATRMALSGLRIDATTVGEAELTYVLDRDDRARLAWGFDVEYIDATGPQRDRVFADAIDGAVAARHPRHHYARSRKVYSCNNGTVLPGTLKRSEGQAATADTAVNHAYDATGYVYDYYQSRFGRDSYNNAGAQIVSSVHYSTNYCNMFWNGSQLVYGDGNAALDCFDLTVLDMVAHEYTHAVTDFESNLAGSGESGAIDEAMSDIFAANIEAWVDGAISADTWKIGEDGLPPALRYMDDPTKDGASKDYYFSGIGSVNKHNACGVANLAYVLLVQGGHHPRHVTTVVVPGIGMQKAEQIFYRANTNYMTASTNFLGARNATLHAAEELYSQSEANAVGLAWSAVGVGGDPTSVGPADPPPMVARVLDASPNPFSPSTRIRVRLANAGAAALHVYDSNGRMVRELIASGAPRSESFVAWDGRDGRGTRLSSGIYFIRLAGVPEESALRVVVLN